MAFCAHVGSSAASSPPRTLIQTSCLARCGGSVVHHRRRDKVENARLHVLRVTKVAQEVGHLAL
eukprot:2231462-Pleurochrysis_carterae.AAC.3